MRDRLPALALVAAILVAWEAYVRVAGIEPVVLPAPSRIATALWDFRGDALRHGIPTVLETVTGFPLFARSLRRPRWTACRSSAGLWSRSS
jgi:ABC-type nitrate/sulfonate/bicarbonate transport system permease component